MYIFCENVGRIGNAIFRYLAAITLIITYGYKLVNKKIFKGIKFSDSDYINWKNNYLQGKINKINKRIPIVLNDYYQHSDIYIKLWPQIINYIINNPNDILTTDGNTKTNSGFHYNQFQITSSDLLENSTKNYKITVHLRLEDFIKLKFAICPESIQNVIDRVKIDKDEQICLVVNYPKTDLEIEYINYFKERNNIIIESNSVMEDFKIMKNAEILICSCSTLSWCAALFGNASKVFIPRYNHGRIHETFSGGKTENEWYDYKIWEKCL